MKLRMRFSMRTLMVAVAVIGLIAAAAQMVWRSRSFRQQAEAYALSERRSARVAQDRAQLAGELERDHAGWREGDPPFRHFVDQYRAEAKRTAILAARNAELKRKWQRAARYPWLPVEPDPPLPP